MGVVEEWDAAGSEKITYSAPRSNTTGHRCFPRDDSQGAWDRIVAWYLPPFHLLASLTFTYVMVFAVDGSMFNIGYDTRTPAIRLSQSDLTTLVSASLVCVRWILNTWATLSVWRTVFILLETSGLTLQQLSSTVSFGIPTSIFDWKNTRTAHGGPLRVWSMLLICGLLLPSQFAAPIASGSISWIPETVSSPVVSPLRDITVPGPGTHWDWYQMFPMVRRNLVLRSAAYASMINREMDPSHASIPVWRGVPSAQSSPLKTIVNNITIPYFAIRDWEWIQDVSTVPSGLRDAVAGQGALNITSDENPMQDPIEGNAALLKTEQWQRRRVIDPRAPHFAYPDSQILAAKKYAAVLVERIPGQSCRPVSDTFGELGVSDSGFLNISYNNNYTNCYVFASFLVTAGRQTCLDCNISAPSTVSPFRGLERDTEAKVEPDPLADEIFSMMPEVMHTIAGMNATDSPQIGRLRQWTMQLLVQAYCSTWTTMSLYFADPELSLSSAQMIPVQVVRASVSRRRMWVWMGFNALVSVSGLLLLSWQTTCRRKPVVDPVLAVVMLDPGSLLEEDKSGLCNASRLAECDKAAGILRLRQLANGGDDGHFILEKASNM